MAENGQITDNNKRGIGDIYQATSPFNANNQQIASNIQKINTVFLAKIISVSTEGTEGTKTVMAQPLICQIDANGNALPSPKLVEIPHYRVQAGTGAFVVNPHVGDIGVFVCAKRDISKIKNGVNDPQTPASFRSFDLADSIMIATIHTETASTYIYIDPDSGTIEIKAPESLTINTESAIVNANETTINGSKTTINAPETTINGHLTVLGGITVSGGGGSSMSGDFKLNGTMTATNDVIANGISLNSHVHSGVQAGGSDTSVPKQ